MTDNGTLQLGVISRMDELDQDLAQTGKAVQSVAKDTEGASQAARTWQGELREVVREVEHLNRTESASLEQAERSSRARSSAATAARQDIEQQQASGQNLLGTLGQIPTVYAAVAGGVAASAAVITGALDEIIRRQEQVAEGFAAAAEAQSQGLFETSQALREGGLSQRETDMAFDTMGTPAGSMTMAERQEFLRKLGEDAQRRGEDLDLGAVLQALRVRVRGGDSVSDEEFLVARARSGVERADLLAREFRQRTGREVTDQDFDEFDRGIFRGQIDEAFDASRRQPIPRDEYGLQGELGTRYQEDLIRRRFRQQEERRLARLPLDRVLAGEGQRAQEELRRRGLTVYSSEIDGFWDGVGAVSDYVGSWFGYGGEAQDLAEGRERGRAFGRDARQEPQRVIIDNPGDITRRDGPRD